jgi:hypothetical protein
MTRKWCVMDLVVSHQTGKLRETAVWSNIGKLAMTWAFVYTVYQGKAAFSEGLWLAYGMLVIGHEVVKAKQNQDQQRLDKENATITHP